MRTVHPSDMVAHLWANRSQDNARNGGSTLYFEGDTIYSYRNSFPIARHVEHRGKRAVMFTTETYSVTTSQHCSIVSSAIPDETPVFHVPDLGSRYRPVPDHAANLKSYTERISNAARKLARCKPNNRTWHESRILNLNGERNAYAKFWGIRCKPITGTVAEIADRCNAERERIEKAERARKAREAAAVRKRLAENVAKWRAGEDVSVYGLPDTLLRVRGAHIQTSRGAVVPVADAERVFPIIARCRANSTEWHRNGETITIGQFEFDRIAPTGDIVVGCHSIPWSEVERIAGQLGLLS